MKKFFNTFKSFKKNAGFTLIELLVVIGILGILAAALIATIDPFEQLKKATDANVKNTLVEFLTANVRYYTTHNALPWSDTSASAACYNTGTPPASSALTSAQMLSCLSQLISDGELKSGFTTVTSILQSILASGTTNSATACFQPQSKSQERDPNTKFIYSGGAFVTSNTCISQGGVVTSCYWCSN